MRNGLMVLLLFVSGFATGQQRELVQNLYLSYSKQQLTLNRDALVRAYYRSQDQPLVESMHWPAANYRQSFALGFHKSMYRSENYRHDVYAGLYARASFLSSVLTEKTEHKELARIVSDDPEPVTIVTEEFSKSWLNYNSDQLETGISLEAVYRFNRRFNLHYGFRAGALLPASARFSEIINTETRTTYHFANRQRSESVWNLEPKMVHQKEPIGWASDAILGIDYKISANRPFFVSATLMTGMIQLQAKAYKQVAPMRGIEIRVSSNL